MAGTMTNEEIMSEFEELFGTETEPDEELIPDPEETEETDPSASEEETEEEPTVDNEEPTDESEEEEEDASKDESEAHHDNKPSPKAKQNHAFAEQRLQIKKQEQFIRSLGKLIGFDDTASIDEISDKIKEVLIEKEAKDNNISVELAKRLDKAEEVLQENDRIKTEKKVQEDFSELIDKYNLDEEGVNEFTTYLMESGRNPLIDKSVDIEYEYLKLHHNDIVQAAVQEALAKEEERRKKVEEKAASGAPSGKSEKDETKLNTVKDLDKYFDSLDL